MTAAVSRRKAPEAYDYSLVEQFKSYYFSAHDEHMSVYARLGLRANEDETWFVVYKDGKMYSLRNELYAAGESPLSVSQEGEEWIVQFDGKLNEATEVSFHARFSGTQRSIDFSSDMPARRMATGIANERWSKEFFQQLQQVSGQRHYEQEGILEGEICINGEKTVICLPCVRDNSYGKRDWNYMNNHLWLMAISAEGQFNYSMVSYPVMSVLEVGNYRDAEGLHLMHEANLDLSLVGQGRIPEELSFKMQLEDGRVLETQARVISGVSYQFQGGSYILHENIASFTINGKPYRGILEIGFNRDSRRYFNQRNIKRIHR